MRNIFPRLDSREVTSLVRNFDGNVYDILETLDIVKKFPSKVAAKLRRPEHSREPHPQRASGNFLPYVNALQKVYVAKKGSTIFGAISLLSVFSVAIVYIISLASSCDA